MKYLLGMFLLISTVQVLAISNDAVCVFDHKDYDSPGFGIPKHSGIHTFGRFGCHYICSCKGKSMRVVHVLEESHLDMDTKNGTGGPKRAKWFICPYSTKNWRPIMTTGEEAAAYGAKLIAYNVEVDYSPRAATEFFTPKNSKDVNSAQIHAWAESQCQ